MRLSLKAVSAGIVAAATASLAGGCVSYDYLQRTDRVSYHAGDAVAANLESETINPSSPWIYDTSGLGKNGNVMPKDTQGSQAGSVPPGAPRVAPSP